MNQVQIRHSDVLLELNAHVNGVGGQYRTLSDRILVGNLALDAEQEALSAAWRASLEKVTQRVGDVAAIGADIARTHAVGQGTLEAVYAWLQTQGLPDLTEPSSLTLFGCRAAPYHHDIYAFSDSLFCVVWTSEDAGLELVFPQLDKRVALEMGTVVVFDSGQPHGVLWKGKKHYVEKSYEALPVQTFISVDFSATEPSVMEQMNIRAFEGPFGWPGVVVGEHDAGPKVQSRTGRWTT